MVIKPSLRQFKHGVYLEVWDDPIYATRYWVAVCDNLEEFKTFYKKTTGKDCTELSDSASAFTDEFRCDENYYNVLMVYTRNVSVGVIAHECVHALNRTFKFHGMELDEENDEHQAYYMHYLVNRCTEVFDEYDQRITKPRKKANEKAPKTTKRAANKRSTR